METAIVICLLVVIALMLHDKVASKNKQGQKANKTKESRDLPDIMGQPKPMRSLSGPSSASESQNKEQMFDPANLDIEYDENEIVGIQVPQEELDEVFSNVPDFGDDEEEWDRYGISGGDNSLAQGVTFDELSAVGALLQKEKLEQPQKETAVAIVQRLQGTELFSLLENSMEGASKKIAALLDSTLSEKGDGSSTLRKNSLGDFDIGEFI
jgi:hypothetical protein